nr:type 1 glutamine amidotransferase domain-containing protein [Plesiocystis pacifica]
MVLTSHAQLGDSGKPTGFWAEEMAAPYYLFTAAGAELTLASPKGGQAPVDPGSLEPAFLTAATRRYQADAELQSRLANTVRLAEVDGADFDAVFYPGGHGPMYDLTHDRDSIALIESFARAGKVVAAVCHAPAVLLEAKTADGRPLVEGREVAGFTNSEEAAVGMTELVPFLLEDALVARGGVHRSVEDWAPLVVTDGALITGQNPASSEAVAEALLQALA